MSKILAFTLSLALIPLAHAASDSVTNPVIVELFTSEGCSSCPPADALLTKLDQMRSGGDTQVLILGEHVDYWNHLGWKDRFSSADFSRRQSQYGHRFALDSIYTPQMVIDGLYQAGGNDETGVRQKISLAAQKLKPVRIVLSWNNSVLSVQARGTNADKGDLFLAITENGLTSSVAHGENGGRTLRHSGVVRELRRIGALSHGELSTNIPVHIKSDWKAQNLRTVVFTQNPGNGEITGAAVLDFP